MDIKLKHIVHDGNLTVDTLPIFAGETLIVKYKLYHHSYWQGEIKSKATHRLFRVAGEADLSRSHSGKLLRFEDCTIDMQGPLPT